MTAPDRTCLSWWQAYAHTWEKWAAATGRGDLITSFKDVADGWELKTRPEDNDAAPAL